MAKDHSNQGGGHDGGDPDAEIARHRAEQEAREQVTQRDAERAERLRRERGGN